MAGHEHMARNGVSLVKNPRWRWSAGKQLQESPLKFFCCNLLGFFYSLNLGSLSTLVWGKVLHQSARVNISLSGNNLNNYWKFHSWTGRAASELEESDKTLLSALKDTTESREWGRWWGLHELKITILQIIKAHILLSEICITIPFDSNQILLVQWELHH